MEGQIAFGPFRCDPLNARVWRGEQALSLTPKAFAVLLHLLRHPGRLVSKEELLAAVWQETYVGEAVLKVSVGEIRKILADDAKAPRFIETVHRRGYRFIGKVASSQHAVASSLLAPPQDSRPSIQHSALSTEHSVVVGRERELAQLHGLLAKALNGERQIVFVTGEPGIGKTALVEAFLSTPGLQDRSLPASDPRYSTPILWIARGQCLEQYGTSEAYLPVLDAFGRLGRGPRQERLVQLLKQYAPTWLVQMPALISTEEREGLQRETLGATAERMLREMAEALEALTVETPLVLTLEDLHWSDYATLDLVAALARRRGPARLLVIGVYRPVDIIVSGHPLKSFKQELQGHGLCEEIALQLLTPLEVATYLEVRFPESAPSYELAHALHRRTDGNPLFLINFIDYLLGQNLLRRQGNRWELHGGIQRLEDGMPESIRQMIERRIEQIAPDEQRVLEAASVAGMEFTAATAAAALEEPENVIEEQCDRLARRQQFLRAREPKTQPDGATTAVYAFTHALYRNVFWQRLSTTQRLRLHQRVGQYLEQGHHHQTDAGAAELAAHFEEGHEYVRAVHYWLQAARNAVQRHAPREAIAVLTQAAALSERVPGVEQWRLRMQVLEYRGLVHRSMGMMAQAAEDFLAWAESARASNDLTGEINAYFHLASAQSWLDRGRCLAAVEQGLVLSARSHDELLRAHIRGWAAYWRLLWDEWQEEDAMACAQAVDSARRADARAQVGLHVRRLAYFQALQTRYGEARRAAEEGARIALAEGDVSEYLTGLFFWGWTLLHQGQWGEQRRLLGEGLHLAERNGHRQWAALFRLELAWLYEQVGDFPEALSLCEAVRKESQTIHLEYGQLLSTVLLGHAHLGFEEYDRAFTCFTDITQRLQRERLLMDWICRMPLLLGMSEYWLKQKNFARARHEAEQLCILAARPGERTYLALGYRLLAEIALAQSKWEEAEKAVTQAIVVLDGVEAPLAEWRVYATAARFAEQRRQHAQARARWNRSKSVLLRLAESLEQDDPLRQTFLTQPVVQEILQRG